MSIVPMIAQLTSRNMRFHNYIHVVINGATKEMGKAAVVAVTKACRMEICGMEEILQIPIINGLTMILGSISQFQAVGIVVDFTNPSFVYDNVKQVHPGFLWRIMLKSRSGKTMGGVIRPKRVWFSCYLEIWEFVSPVY
ncbi:hypothetical protein JHK86_001098 [Glycine max]|nr:hypothetical protein JHK86_001098 [Glycine max]